jgi:hypothetical protein
MISASLFQKIKLETRRKEVSKKLEKNVIHKIRTKKLRLVKTYSMDVQSKEQYI